MNTATAAKYRVLGTNDDASECSCCGRQGLKMVVWMQPLDENGEEFGMPVPFGRVCAANAAGWGHGTKSSIDRRIAKEMAETLKHFQSLASARISSLESEGELVRTRVAFAFDWKSGTHQYGYIFTLANDQIAGMADPVYQAAEIKDAKARRNAKHPICRFFDERLSADEIRSMLACGGAA